MAVVGSIGAIMSDPGVLRPGLVYAAVALLLSLICLRRWYRQRSFPPGPSFLTTIFLSVRALVVKRTTTHSVFTDLAEKYGAIFSVWIGTDHLTVVNDFETAREALVKTPEYFPNRRSASVITAMFGHGGGVLHENGHAWKVRRRFGMNAMRIFGVGKKNLESKINEEAAHLVQSFADHRGGAFDPGSLVINAVSNIISHISFNRRFEYTDAAFQKMIRIIQAIGAVSILEVGNVFPFLVRTSLYTKKKLKFRRFKDFIEEQLVEHKATFDATNPRDLIDLYLIEVMKEAGEKGGHQDAEAIFTESNMWALIQDLFLAGVETTSNSFLWLLLLLTIHPDVQRKIQQEIDDVIGRTRQPAVADMQSMPYTQATILEAFRRRPVVTVFNREAPVDRDVTIGGYTVPRDSYLLVNIFAMHHDPKAFPEPKAFRPERFLTVNEEGKLAFNGKGQPLMSFGSGRRSCMGDTMAKAETFIFLVNILQRFHMALPEGSVPDLDGLPGRMWAPLPYAVHATDR